MVAIVGAAIPVWHDSTDSSSQKVQHRRPETESRAGFPDRAEAICSKSARFRCLLDEGHLAVLVRARDGHANAPTLLLDLGGPGTDVLSVLELLPKWTNPFNVLVLPEPWSTFDGCVAGEMTRCADDARPLSDSDYAQLVRRASREWGEVDGMVGFSYGAVRLMPLIGDPAFKGAPTMLIAPAPRPDVPGRAWTSSRERSSLRLVRSTVPGDRQAIGRLLSGRRGVAAPTARLALVALAGDLPSNRPFLSKLLGTTDSVTPAQREELIAAAQSISLTGSRSSAVQRAYFADICSRYSGWTAAVSAFGQVHARACDEQRAPHRIAVPQRRPTGSLELWVNHRDPVTAPTLQEQWRSFWHGVQVHRYSASTHNLPPAQNLDGFLRKVRTFAGRAQ